jgi:hypothetical protein
MARLITITTLAIALAAAVVFGIVQRSEARALKSRVAALEGERNALRRAQSEWELRNRDLAALLESARQTTPEAGAEEVGRRPNAVTEGSIEGGGLMRPEANRFAAMMSRPEVRELLVSQQKAGLDGRYAALFRKLGLSGKDLEKFKTLLVQKQSTMAEVLMEARNQGISGRENRDELRQLAEQLQADVDANIRATLGENAYTQYKNYETTLPQRSVTNQLEQRLSYTGSPLQSSQVEQLVQILHDTAATNPSRNASGATPALAIAGPGAAFGNAGGTRITDAAIAQAKGILAPAQVSALQALQQEQQAAAQLARQLRAGRRGNNSSDAVPPKG